MESGGATGEPSTIFHDQIVRADIVELADVGVVEGGDDSRFALEAFGEVFFGDFDGYDAVEARVAGFVDFAHASGAERSQDFVGAETGSWC